MTAKKQLKELQKQYRDIIVGIVEKKIESIVDEALESNSKTFGGDIQQVICSVLCLLQKELFVELGIQSDESADALHISSIIPTIDISGEIENALNYVEDE